MLQADKYGELCIRYKRLIASDFDCPFRIFRSRDWSQLHVPILGAFSSIFRALKLENSNRRVSQRMPI